MTKKSEHLKKTKLIFNLKNFKTQCFFQKTLCFGKFSIKNEVRADPKPYFDLWVQYKQRTNRVASTHRRYH